MIEIEEGMNLLSLSSFHRIKWSSKVKLPTVEHVFYYLMFHGKPGMQMEVGNAKSRYELLKMVKAYSLHARPDWFGVRTNLLRTILQTKAEQHEDVHGYLVGTGEEQIVYKNDFEFWGSTRQSLGDLWMQVRHPLIKSARDEFLQKMVAEIPYGDAQD